MSEHDRRLCRSQIRHSMIISITSWGSLMAGDEPIVQIAGQALHKNILRILAMIRYQIRLTNSSITEAGVKVKCGNADREVLIPDKEDVGVFFGSIVLCGQFFESPAKLTGGPHEGGQIEAGGRRHQSRSGYRSFSSTENHPNIVCQSGEVSQTIVRSEEKRSKFRVNTQIAQT